MPRVRRYAIALAVLAIVDTVAVYGWYAPGVRAFTRASRTPSSADAAVVFFGALVEPEMLDKETEARVADASWLYRSGVVRSVIAVGGARAGRRPGSQLMRDALVERGVPPALVHADSSSYDSHSNWDQASRIAREGGMDSLVLVSAPTHLYRLRSIGSDPALTVTYFARNRSTGPLSFWMSAHHEIAALTADAIMPRSWYVRIIRTLRRAP